MDLVHHSSLLPKHSSVCFWFCFQNTVGGASQLWMLYFSPRTLKHLKNIEQLKRRYIRTYIMIWSLNALFMPKRNLIIMLIQVNVIKNYLRFLLGPQKWSNRAFPWLKRRYTKKRFFKLSLRRTCLPVSQAHTCHLSFRLQCGLAWHRSPENFLIFCSSRTCGICFDFLKYYISILFNLMTELQMAPFDVPHPLWFSLHSHLLPPYIPESKEGVYFRYLWRSERVILINVPDKQLQSRSLALLLIKISSTSPLAFCCGGSQTCK